jgi:hypothetical protein
MMTTCNIERITNDNKQSRLQREPKMNKAYIKNDSGSLWMIIDGEDPIAWPIAEDEIALIRDACNDYLTF